MAPNFSMLRHKWFVTWMQKNNMKRIYINENYVLLVLFHFFKLFLHTLPQPRSTSFDGLPGLLNIDFFLSSCCWKFLRIILRTGFESFIVSSMMDISNFDLFNTSTLIPPVLSECKRIQPYFFYQKFWNWNWMIFLA